MKFKHQSCTIESARLSKSLKLGKAVTIGYGSCVLAGEVGDYTFINKYCLIDSNVTTVGKFCSIAYNVRIGLGGHPADWLSTHPFLYDKKYGFVKKDLQWTSKSEKTVVGNDVWIGANATILGGVIIGDGAIIGAHSLVNKDVEPYSIVVGTPAKHIRYRHDETTIKSLLKSKWWDKSAEELKNKIAVLSDPKDFIEHLS